MPCAAKGRKMSNLELFEKDKFDHAVKLATTLSKSAIVPQHFRGKPEDVFACLVLGRELGFEPMQSLNAIVMIQGNCTLKAATMLALARAKVKDLSVKIEELDNAVMVTITRGGDSYTAIWNDEKATAMGLIKKDNYLKQKLTMLRWRSVSEALKIMCPDILMGLSATEELQDVEGKDIDLRIVTQSDKELEQDFPIPENEKIAGPEYRMQHGKFRGKQVKDVGLSELKGYYDELLKRKSPKIWESELIRVFSLYFTEIQNENTIEISL